MLFSSLETFALFILIIMLFKINPAHYAKRALFVLMLVNLQSYFLQSELDVANLVPVITIIILTLFFTVVVKIPLLPSAFRTILVTVLYGAIKSLLLIILYGDTDVLEQSVRSGYLLQSYSSAVLLIISWLMYKYNFGFSYPYDKLKLKFEYAIVTALMLIFLILISYILYMNQIWLNILFFALNLACFLFFEIQERNSSRSHSS
ncbi:hypothetical protein ACFSVM_21640 [Paenibacillus shunpengii]|uniref:Uncharacterized protein n=1 Tax=Paenibacillus shunpengii TaxID=2054424 RepID=A0ABW5SUP6_9BACL|nr:MULTISPECIES: hypothetical protein [unclassified Paenibacillus]SDX02503.1 hypothetical protein SAMN05518848_10488 [Paenibacillus sp. PDC88]